MKSTDAIGLLLGVLGLLFTLVQLYKTRSAAEAARDAALLAVTSIRKLEAATKMQEICARSRELLTFLHGRSLASSAHAAFELRDAMARYGHDEQSQAIVKSGVWERAASEAQEIHERLESAALLNRIGADERATLLHSVAKLHTEFTAFAAKALSNGTSNANT
jgi:hypothetical protein